VLGEWRSDQYLRLTPACWTVGCSNSTRSLLLATPRCTCLEWTGADQLRHTEFVALRGGKEPRKVVRETWRVSPPISCILLLMSKRGECPMAATQEKTTRKIDSQPDPIFRSSDRVPQPPPTSHAASQK
jgi:hypothetical protein